MVKKGDTVDTIAQDTGIAVDALLWANQIAYPYRLAVGQSLYIPPKEEGTGEEGGRDLYVFGYAYPFINSRTLDETLPFLTDLYVFSYGFTAEGNLVHPVSDDRWMIQAAREAGVGAVMTLTPIDSSGTFNNNLISVLVHDSAVQQKLIWELGRTMQESGFTGLDIDFEYVRAEDGPAYVEFVSRTRQILNLFGYFVTVALAPKTSAAQRGLLYEGIDYRLLGEAADRVMLMTYEWGYSQGPPMAVAPIHMVRRVAEYAVSEIPAEKISLGIPNYGYDWPLPYEKDVTRANTIHTLEAIQLAIDHGSEIYFDQTARSPYFYYWQYGIRHEVWFEDPRSLLAKFQLIEELGLTGAGYWQLMNFFRANWLMLKEMFSIYRPTEE